MAKGTFRSITNCRTNPAMVKTRLLRFSNEVLDKAVDSLLQSCDYNKRIIENRCNDLLHAITVKDNSKDDVREKLKLLNDTIIEAKDELGTIENFVSKEDIEKLSMLVALASEGSKGFYRLRKTYLKLYQSKIDPIVDISVEYLNEPVELMKCSLQTIQESIAIEEEELEIEHEIENEEGYKYISDYRDLNNLAKQRGFVLCRHNGDHGIFRNREGYIAVIPQGRTVGKGLSILIQKTLDGKNTKGKNI